jgi:hypothetical protein
VTKVLASMADKIQSAPAAWASLTAYAVVYGLLGRLRRSRAGQRRPRESGGASFAHADHDEIIVTLTIDPGYHVNAEPCVDRLSHTNRCRGPKRTRRQDRYTRGTRLQTKFSPEGISVYEGSVEITAALPKGWLASAAHALLRIEVQACTEQICLPPATLTSYVSY